MTYNLVASAPLRTDGSKERGRVDLEAGCGIYRDVGRWQDADNARIPAKKKPANFRLG